MSSVSIHLLYSHFPVIEADRVSNVLKRFVPLFQSRSSLKFQSLLCFHLLESEFNEMYCDLRAQSQTKTTERSTILTLFRDWLKASPASLGRKYVNV